jgi:hypothetical protein
MNDIVFVPPKKCLGPSHITSILGYNKFRDASELKGQLEDGFHRERNTPNTSFGIHNEKIGLIAYSRYKGCKIQKAGYAVDKLCKRFVGRADGLVGDDGGVEIKCHANGTLLKSVPIYYLPQIVAYMYLYDRSWWDLVSCIFDEEGKLSKYKIFRIRWVDYEATWQQEWYPKIRDFIDSIKWKK